MECESISFQLHITIELHVTLIFQSNDMLILLWPAFGEMLYTFMFRE